MSNAVVEDIVRASRLFVAALALLSYDHVTTLDQEISYFWSGQWTLSRMLYLSVRYLTVLNLIFMSFGHVTILPVLSCAGITITIYILSNIILLLSQAILTFRVWYLFTHNKRAQLFVAYVFLACVLSQIILMAITFCHSTFARVEYANGVSLCGYVPPTTTWHVYLPAVLLHVMMYMLTVYRVAHSITSIFSKAFVQRFIEEGAPLYLIATAALLEVFFNLAVTGNSTVLPIIESYLTSAVITVAVCHALLSIRTLAAKLHVDSNWLLSHNELSRLRYRRGLDNAELLVEVDSQYEGDRVELLQIENGREKANEPGVPRLSSKSCLATVTSGEASADPPRLSIQAV